MADDAQEIIGKWTVRIKDWVWEYEFLPDGKVTWQDTRSSEKGVGRWSLLSKFINISWIDSSTKESWYRPITPLKQQGWYSSTYYTGKFEMQKVIAPPPGDTDLTWFEFEPDDPARPGQINILVSSPRNDAQYIDRVVTAVGFGIYLGGYHVFCEGVDVPVFVPEQMVDFAIGVVAEASNEIFNTIDEAKSAAASNPRQPSIAYFRGAGEPSSHQP
ncbi:hypothetical protein [Paraburkholderia largidicola]|uniref:Uncharacterized protein n=1 Tax=Paraburkholderia largidicola TaxID=3014751 RepID=A0A7I8C265_9BURK|nr:hypothetical protein [Paraburkholderia sp. PGU16]BCF95166.1 hypothetical protein PPGU16_82330 [Paraburkholderia sp. PGU16]